MVFRVPPVAWMVMVRKMLVLLEAVVVDEAGDLHHLAAEADHQRAADIGMRGIAPLGALHDVEAFQPLPAMPQPEPMDEGDDAVDMPGSRRGCRSG